MEYNGTEWSAPVFTNGDASGSYLVKGNRGHEFNIVGNHALSTGERVLIVEREEPDHRYSTIWIYMLDATGKATRRSVYERKPRWRADHTHTYVFDDRIFLLTTEDPSQINAPTSAKTEATKTVKGFTTCLIEWGAGHPIACTPVFQEKGKDFFPRMDGQAMTYPDRLEVIVVLSAELYDTFNPLGKLTIQK